MSRSSQVSAVASVKSPVTKYLEFHGKEGVFQYWDKETKQNVVVPLPLRFVNVVERSTITGFSQEHRCNIKCNEVKSTVTEPFKVGYWKDGTSDLANGLYKDIKDNVVAKGGKFTSVIYACHLNQETRKTEFIALKIKGSQIAAYRQFRETLAKDKVSILDVIITVNRSIQKGGAVSYMVPEFSYLKNKVKTAEDKTYNSNENYDYSTDRWKSLESVAEEFCTEYEEYEASRSSNGPSAPSVEPEPTPTPTPTPQPVASNDGALDFLDEGGNDDMPF
jgi:hypothetical protein